MTNLLRRLSFTLVLSALPLAAGAQSNGDYDTSYHPEEPEGETSRPSPNEPGLNVGGVLSANAASTTVELLNRSTSFCLRITPTTYRIDCLSERLNDVRRQLEGVPGTDDIRAALDQASRGLADVARDNSSGSQPRAKFRSTDVGRNVPATARPLVAVDQDKLEVAAQQAIAVIEDAETILLRSAENSAGRAAQYQRIAEALGSNKVLLRSL